MRILLVEDEDRLRDALSRGLRSEGHEVLGAHDGETGLRLASEGTFDVIVCDILVPRINGFQLCQRLRARRVATPILVLTAKDGEWDQAEALDAGADDYLTKPFSFVVLNAHLRALVRRSAGGAGEGAAMLHAGDVAVDFRTGVCTVAGAPVELSRREQALLGALLARPGEVVAKADLLRDVWGEGFDGDPNIVEVYIGYLRRKLDQPFGRRRIETVRGLGYRFNAEPPAR
ncbi:MAG: response regulator transcription factor [Actinomycetota bacterium]|nr:response regulator transcription factor [Actinomycetota bacterium]